MVIYSCLEIKLVDGRFRIEKTRGNCDATQYTHVVKQPRANVSNRLGPVITDYQNVPESNIQAYRPALEYSTHYYFSRMAKGRGFDARSEFY